MDAAGERRLQEYFDGIGGLLGDDARRELFARYALGLLADGERKSIEPIVTRALPDPLRADAEHQRMLHFVSNSRWDDRELRQHAARYALDQMARIAGVQSWIVDDTGFLKQGKHSVVTVRGSTSSSGLG